jgi:hypothetical protein
MGQRRRRREIGDAQERLSHPRVALAGREHLRNIPVEESHPGEARAFDPFMREIGADRDAPGRSNR